MVKISQVVYYALVNLQTRNIPKRKCKSDQYPLIAFMIGHISSCSCCCTGTISFNQSLSAPAIIWCKKIFPSQRPLCLCTCALSSCPAPTRWAWAAGPVHCGVGEDTTLNLPTTFRNKHLTSHLYVLMFPFSRMWFCDIFQYSVTKSTEMCQQNTPFWLFAFS